MDFSKNRAGGYGDCFFSGDILCQKGDEAASNGKGDSRWDSDHAVGAAAHSGGFFPVADFQREAAVGKFSP